MAILLKHQCIWSFMFLKETSSLDVFFMILCTEENKLLHSQHQINRQRFTVRKQRNTSKSHVIQRVLASGPPSSDVSRTDRLNGRPYFVSSVMQTLLCFRAIKLHLLMWCRWFAFFGDGDRPFNIRTRQGSAEGVVSLERGPVLWFCAAILHLYSIILCYRNKDYVLFLPTTLRAHPNHYTLDPTFG